ncbi:efflux RND transporter periplasmic adaptor subunit [Magnetospira thiophila]
MAQTNGPVKQLLTGVVLIGLTGLAYWAYGTYFGTDSTPPVAPPSVTEVAAMTVTRQTLSLDKELPSRTRAFKVAQIRPQVSGIVTERLFEEGGTVQEGQHLYQIDPAPYKAVFDSAMANLNRTRTNVKLAQTKADRFTKLLKTNAVSQQAYEDVIAALEVARADRAVAEASVAAAQVDLNYTKVSAPISGRIGRSSVTPGALVTTNQADAMATITQLDPMYVDLSMPSRDLLSLRPLLDSEQKITVSLYDEDGNPLSAPQGELQFSEVTVDQTTGAVLLRALFPNPDQSLLPGMFVRARLHLPPKEALRVPQSAAVRGANGKLSVWVIDAEGKAQSTPIIAQEAQDHHWLVESGLQSGAVIVTQGFQKIRPGAAVKPVFEATAPQPGKAE